MPDRTHPRPRDARVSAARRLRGLTAVAGAVSTLAFAAPETAPALRHGVVTLSTGVRMQYVAQGDSTGTPVILLHGYSDTWYSYSKLLPLLSPQLRVFALDQRGHGATDKPADGYAMPDLARDVLAFMDAQGIERAAIVGHSMGTFVAQQVAMLAPDRVRALVLLNGAVHVRDFNGIDELAAAIDGLEDPVPLEFTTEFQRSTVHRPVEEAFIARVSEDSRKLPAHAWKAILRGMTAIEPATALTTRQLPALILWGDRDLYVPRAAQIRLQELLSGARLVALEEVGHAPHWEVPERVARELHDFIGALPR